MYTLTGEICSFVNHIHYLVSYGLVMQSLSLQDLALLVLDHDLPQVSFHWVACILSFLSLIRQGNHQLQELRLFIWCHPFRLLEHYCNCGGVSVQRLITKGSLDCTVYTMVH